jgi:hypothetical protein
MTGAVGNVIAITVELKDRRDGPRLGLPRRIRATHHPLENIQRMQHQMSRPLPHAPIEDFVSGSHLRDEFGLLHPLCKRCFAD